MRERIIQESFRNQFASLQGVPGISASLALTRTLALMCDIGKGRVSNVPAGLVMIRCNFVRVFQVRSECKSWLDSHLLSGRFTQEPSRR